MIRQIIIPNKDTYVLEIPESFIGKRIEVIAFEIEDRDLNLKNTPLTIEDLFEKFKNLTFDGKKSYVFNREEASDYE